MIKIDLNSNNYYSTTNAANTNNRIYAISSNMFKQNQKYKVRYAFLSKRLNLSPYPPVALTGYTTNITGQTYGNGTYVTSTPVENANPTWQAFNKLPTGPWRSNNEYAITTGAYTGALTTSVSGVGNINGAYLHILLPNAIVLDSFYFEYNRSSTVEFRNFSIVGSNDGFTFYLVYRGTVNLPGDVGVMFQVANKSTAYNRFRFIAETGSGGQNYIEMAEWYLYEDRNKLEPAIININLNQNQLNYKPNNNNGISNEKKSGVLQVKNKNLYCKIDHCPPITFTSLDANFISVDLYKLDGTTDYDMTESYNLSLEFEEI